MKSTLRLVLSSLVVAAAFFAAGCESLSDGLSERLTPAPVARDFDASFAEVYPAAQRALKSMNYTLARTSVSDGLIRGHTGVRNEASYRSARQRAVKMLVHEIATGGAHVEVWLSESVEDHSKSGSVYAAESPIRDQVAYDAVFAEIDRQLLAAKNAARP